MHSVRRRLHFCAGHRVLDHESKCAHPHGHNYLVYLEAVPETDLDDIGRVVDFGVLKAVVGTWIDENLDHKFLVYEKDVELIEALKSVGAELHVTEKNPTAENIAEGIYEVAIKLLSDYPIRITAVHVEETMNCTASYFPPT